MPNDIQNPAAALPTPPERFSGPVDYVEFFRGLVMTHSPFGLKRQMPSYMWESIEKLLRIHRNDGARGFLVTLDPKAAVRALAPMRVDGGLEK